MNNLRELQLLGSRPKTPIAEGDIVRTPSGREALVCSFIAERAACRYLDDGEEVVLQPRLIAFVRHADELTLARMNKGKGK